MKAAVMLSIRPKWCELIAIGKKTIEVRKTKPRIRTPFKCYIYETQAKDYYAVFHESIIGKVVGEFVCDKVYQYSTANIGGVDISDEEMVEGSCLTRDELSSYEFSAELKEGCIYLLGLYGWHISDLKIYDEPKELSEFCSLNTKYPLKRPPQSWCYVEERENNERD